MKIVKRTLCSLVITALIPVAAQWAVAQETNPMPALSDYGVTPGAAPDLSAAPPQSRLVATGPPSYCSPCRFYSGDFNSASPNAEGLSNENDDSVHLSQLFTPFTVPSGHQWIVTGLFINSLALVNTANPKRTGWSIWTGMSSGNSGTLRAAGTGKATFNPTGRNISLYTEYTIRVNLSAPVTLHCGTYWLNMLPQCTNAGDANCANQRYFEADVEDASPAHHHGPANIVDDSFINSNVFSLNYAPAAATSGCSGNSCDAFSFGVIGTTTTGPLCL
ncbi:MAG: hypothetical protein ACREPW_04655 [Candidatus Binataceae bacterium]